MVRYLIFTKIFLRWLLNLVIPKNCGIEDRMKKIVHIDMDAFFVSVEIRDNPNLANHPVAVGGRADRRGVLSTCNYIARKHGVSSAMSTAIAIKKCPNLIVVPGRMEVYKQVSSQIRDIFKRYTDKVEPLSLDEAYLDLSTASARQGSATLIAQDIRSEIFKVTGLTASAGIAPLKFLSKIASDLNKPNGQFTIRPNEVMQFLENLELRKIPGVGKVTQQKLDKLGLKTCSDVWRFRHHNMIENFGKFGHTLWERCHGHDDRDVEVTRTQKSVGVERTFEYDVSSAEILKGIMVQHLLPELRHRASSHLNTRRMASLGVKVKFDDFVQTTREQKIDRIDTDTLSLLLNDALERGNGKAIRLLGLYVGLEDIGVTAKQLEFSLN